TADDDHLDLVSPDADLRGERRPGQVGSVDDRERRLAVARMPDDERPRPGRHLAGPDVGDAVDLGEAVAAVAGEAEATAVTGDLARPEDRDRDRVVPTELDRPAVDDDPAVDRLRHWRIRSPC